MSVTAEVVGLEAPGLPRSGWGLAPAHGVYYRPAEAKPRTALVAVHYNLDFSQHYLAEPMAQRGFGFLGWNTRYCGNEVYFRLESALADIGLGVQWLRRQGAERIVLLGNSGGGSLMAAYRARGGEGELYASVAAHPGRPDVLTAWLDPAVSDEADPTATDPELDMYDPRNGPPYPPEFVTRYRGAQRERNARITEWCERELARLRDVGFSDRLFTVARTWADLRFVDPQLDPSERPSPACYRGDPAKANRGVNGIGMVNTLRSWLSMWSLEHSECRSSEYLGRISVPSLVVQATADTGVFPSDARAIYEGLAAQDKQLVELEGDHYFRGSRDALADLLADWVGAR